MSWWRFWNILFTVTVAFWVSTLKKKLLQEKLKVLEYFTQSLLHTCTLLNTSTSTCIGIKTKKELGLDYLRNSYKYICRSRKFSRRGPRDNFISWLGGGGYFKQINKLHVVLEHNSKFLSIIHVHLVFCDFQSLSKEASIMYPRNLMFFFDIHVYLLCKF